MPSFTEVFDYIVRTLLLWGERLFAQDISNPNYRYAWAPPIYGRHVGFVICSARNDVKSVNSGPTVEDWRKKQEEMQAKKVQKEYEEQEQEYDANDSFVPVEPRRRGNPNLDEQ